MISKSRVSPLAFAIFTLPLWLHATDSTLDSGFVSTISPGLTSDSYVPPPASPNFNSGTGAVNAVALQSDGKIIAGGNISRYKAPASGSPQTSLKRINPDGSLDTSPSFNTFADTQGQTEVNKILTVADDKLYVGGVFTSYQGTARGGLMRLNADGSLDTTFNTAGISNSNAFGSRYVLALAEQPDGKLLVGGFFNRANGVPRPSLVRFNTDGTLDTTFNPTLPTNASVNDLAILPNGQILAAGSGLRTGTGGARLLVRLNSDGSLDQSLSPSFTSDFGDIDELLVLPDGCIIIGGDFGFVNSGNSYSILALQPNGALDTGFSVFDSTISALAVDGAGRIWAGGSFATYNGIARGRLAILNGGDFESQSGPLTSQVITFPPLADRSNLEAPFVLTATSDSGVLIAYSISGPATLAGSTVTLTGVTGLVTITATQTGNATTSAATPVVRTFTVRDYLADFLANAGVPANLRGPNDDPDGTTTASIPVTPGSQFLRLSVSR